MYYRYCVWCAINTLIRQCYYNEAGCGCSLCKTQTNDNIHTGHNWTPYIKYVVRQLERDADPDAVDQREADLRRKIQDIVFCDIRSDKPLGGLQKQYDVIHTNLVLEIVCEDKEEFYHSFTKFHQYLKPKGYLLCLAALEGSWYLCWNGGDTKWHQLNLTNDDLDKAFEKSGML